jgi:hypothetical protein
MKKLILCLLIFFISLNLFAQKPLAGGNQIALGGVLSSATGFLLLKHYYKDNMAKRYSIGGNGINYSNRPSIISNGYRTKDYNFNLNSFVSYGIQKSFECHENLEPYIGIDYRLNLSTSKNYGKLQVVDSIGTGHSLGDYNISKNNGPTNLTFNFRPLVGLNYYLKKNFIIGVEYSLNILYAGYTFSSSRVQESQTNGIYKRSSQNENAAFNIGSNFKGNLAITFSYCFRNGSSSKPVGANP